MTALTITAPRSNADRTWLADLWRREWGGLTMVSRGKTYALQDLTALIALAGPERVGAATFATASSECELMSLNATAEGQGVGTALLTAVEQAAASAGCTRVFLITSNDNLDALRFYQKRGYRIVAVHQGAIDQARQTKPTIPLVGAHGIPIHDELELARQLS